MKRKIALLLLLSGVASQLLAQKATSGDLNRQMEVTRAYEPTVGTASKLNIKPNMVDTVALRPEINYHITPNPIAQEFDVIPIKVASVNLDMYKKTYPLYIKAGLGYLSQSLLDLYYTPIQKSNGKLGIYMNHYGSWSKIRNDAEVKAPASQTFNKAGVLGEHRFGRYSVSGELGYDFDKVSRYGYSEVTLGSITPTFDPSADALKQYFSTVRGRVNFGNSFEDLSYFNFRMGVDAAHFSDRHDMVQTDLRGYLDLGRLFNNKHELTLHTQYDSYSGFKSLTYEDHQITIAPLYRLKTGKFDLGLGFDYTLNIARGGNKNHFFPRLELKLDVTNGYFVPYLEVNGRLISNDYRSLVARNPYVIQGLAMPNTAEYNARVGIVGSVSSAFSYKLYGGVSRYLNMMMFSNFYSMNYYGNVFVGMVDNGNMWTVGGDVEGRISGAFSLEGSVQYRGYDIDNLEKAIGMPSISAMLGVKYSYQDKLILKLGGDLIGKRYFNQTHTANLTWIDLIPMDPQVVLNFGAEYKLTNKFGLFLNANNLLNSKIYNYGSYPALGINGMVGVTMQF